MIVSFGAVPFGIYYYSAQLSASPAWQWPLIPDSPVAAGLYGLAVLLHHIRRPSRTLDLVAGAMMSKIGMWTVFVLLFHADVYFTPDALALRVPILATHALMLPMAFIPLATHRAPERPRTLALGAQVASALLALDAIDYTLSTHPWVPTRGIEVVAAAAVVSTITACALVFAAESMSPAEGRPAEDAKRE
jgi:uncharacterized membrane protein YpjA